MTPYVLLLTAIFIIITFFVNQRKHLLMALLCLEAMILTLVALLIFTNASNPMNNAPMFIIILTMGACEASLGLALLVMMTRSYGSDTLNFLMNNKC